jgi:hypothetical protein
MRVARMVVACSAVVRGEAVFQWVVVGLGDEGGSELSMDAGATG